MLTIGQVAKQTGLSIETLRFYEISGLIPAPPRKESGYRLYPAETVPMLKFIKNAKDLGFTLNEIKEFLSLQNTREATKADIRERTIKKIAELDRKIQALNRMKEALGHLVQECDGEGPVSECPILKAMADDNPEQLRESSEKLPHENAGTCYHTFS